MIQVTERHPQNPATEWSKPALLSILRDIAKKVQLSGDFCITHPSYQSFELPPEVLERLIHLPADVKARYWATQLRSFLYGIYYNGSMQSVLALGTEPQSLYIETENNSVLGVDPAFFERLHQSNTGQGYFDSDWIVIREEEDTLAVQKNGLTLHVDPKIHLRKGILLPSTGDSIDIRMPKNFFQNGFYMSVGDAGAERSVAPNHFQTIVRVYFNLSPEGAVAMMGDLTQVMNDAQLAFTFKVLYNPSEYNRYDSGVFYFAKDDYEQVHAILEQLYAQHRDHFLPQTPLFTKELELGIGMAEEPDQKFGDQESFGMNRCQIVANALLEMHQQNKNSIDARLEAIFEHFKLVGLDWRKPHLNSNSEDIYQVLNV